MSNLLKIIPAFLSGLLACLLIPATPLSGSHTTPLLNNAVQSTACDTTRSVQASGAATLMVSPDRVLIQLGVQSSAASIEAVQNGNATAMQKVIKALTAQGIESKDISTDIYIVEPVYENYDSLYIKGYRINNQIAVTLRDVKKTGVVIAAALGAGANQVQNVEFYSGSLRTYRDQARDLAIKAAQEKAAALAKAAGAETGCVISINETSASYYNGWWSGRSQNLWAQNTLQNAGPAAAGLPQSDTPLSLGQIAIRAEVSVSYALK